SIREHILPVCILILFAITLSACGGSNRDQPLNQVDFSQVVTVNSTVFAASSKPAYDALVRSLAANDLSEVKRMMLVGDVFMIEPGERGTVLASSGFAYQVRFTSGQHAGQVGWFGMEFAD
ncbi:MAG: hypothetical protein KDE31_38580, partial [Caldilineaceae bacterium]|nr:hypothetical protein [Caldilineaceae bacterium]